MIAENIKKIRKELHLSVARLSEKLNMPAVTLTNYERKERTPSANLFIQLHRILNINLNWLVSGQGEMFISTCENTLEKSNNIEIVKNTDTFYKRFNQIQKENDLNDYQLSKLTGIDEVRIEKLGIGKVLPTLEELNALKSHFDVSIDWLLYGETPCKNAQSEINTLSAEEIHILKKLAQKTTF